MRTAVARSARGAARYSQTTDYPTGVLDESALFAPDDVSPARTWNDVIDDALAIRSLPDDWDGEGSPAPEPELAAWVSSYLLRLKNADFPAPDRVIATVNGAVQMEWQLPVGYLEIEAAEPGEPEARLLLPGALEAVDVVVEF